MARSLSISASDSRRFISLWYNSLTASTTFSSRSLSLTVRASTPRASSRSLRSCPLFAEGLGVGVGLGEVLSQGGHPGFELLAAQAREIRTIIVRIGAQVMGQVSDHVGGHTGCDGGGSVSLQFRFICSPKSDPCSSERTRLPAGLAPETQGEGPRPPIRCG